MSLDGGARGASVATVAGAFPFLFFFTTPDEKKEERRKKKEERKKSTAGSSKLIQIHSFIT